MSMQSDLGLSPRLRQDFYERLGHAKTQLFWAGVALAVAGILALIFPVITSLTVELLVGWVLILAGAARTYSAFSIEGTGQFFGQLLLGLLKLGLGVYLITHPGVGIVALTLLLAAVFMVDGAVQIGMAFDVRPRDGWLWLLFSGIISIAAGLLIAAGMPGTSLYIIGLLVGINFLAGGIALIMLSRSVGKRLTA
ncbi:MAG: HdeD family acid-resistance protein [Hyphomicrobium sp.]